jgi:pre-mRNA-processing factor SLU7
MASGLSEYKKREEEKKARQAGNLAPEIDAASGKMINPHNPEYITKRPWYLGESGPSLNHHARQRDDSILSLQETEEILARQPKKFLGRATVFRKGACENCGAMTHKKKDCVERPRSLGKTAKVSGMDIAPDEAPRGVQEGKLGWDGKRDQWAGYRAEDHERVIERYAQMEEERKRQAISRKAEKEREKEEKRKEKEAARLKRKEEKAAAKRDPQAAVGDKRAEQGSKAINQESRNGGEVGEGEEGEEEGEEGSESESGGSEASDSDSDYDSDEEDEDEGVREYLLKDKDNKDFQGRVARQGGVGGAQMKVSVRNLRIREDTAKYLRNLDPNSAYYDPKTRAMRDNPLPGTHPEELAYAGDNYVRTTGDTVALARMQVFALEAQEEGIDVHAEANPTAAILAKKRFEEAQGAEKEEARKRVMEAYGAEKYR